MPKMRIFWNKNSKNYLSVGVSAPEPLLTTAGLELCLPPQTPMLLLLPTIASLSSLFLALIAFYYPSNKNKITTVNVLLLLLPQFLHLFFISNFIVFVDRKHNNISCPRVHDILATPLLKQK